MLLELRRNVSAQLPAFLSAQRWFGGKALRISRVEIIDVVRISNEETGVVVFMVRVWYAEGAAQETYSIPLVVGAPSEESLVDAFSCPQFPGQLLDMIKREENPRGEKGGLRGCRASTFSELLAASEALPARRLSGEQSNSSVIYGDRAILKFFRRIEEGENPDLEIGRFLTEKAKFPHAARIVGWIEYRPEHAKAATQSILQEFVPNQGDAWRYAQGVLTPFYAQAADFSPALTKRELSPSEECEQFASEPMRRLLADMSLLGKRTAELHLALSSDKQNEAFAPEPFTAQFQNSLTKSFAELARGTLQLLKARIDDVPPEYRDRCKEVAGREQVIFQRLRRALSQSIDAARIRIHGDYHLGQVLYTGDDFVIIDFEGEPARPLAERRIKQSPLQDVAGMLRSFEYAAFAPLLMPASDHSVSADKSAGLRRLAEAWSRCAANTFLRQYYETSGEASYIPGNPEQRAALLETYLLVKAIYELGYELNNRPVWVGIPLEGISRLLSSEN